MHRPCLIVLSQKCVLCHIRSAVHHTTIPHPFQIIIQCVWCMKVNALSWMLFVSCFFSFFYSLTGTDFNAIYYTELSSIFSTTYMHILKPKALWMTKILCLFAINRTVQTIKARALKGKISHDLKQSFNNYHHLLQIFICKSNNIIPS